MSADLQLNITPFLIVSNASGATAFYEAAFDATILEKYTNDGRTNARIGIGNADFWNLTILVQNNSRIACSNDFDNFGSRHNIRQRLEGRKFYSNGWTKRSLILLVCRN